MSKKTQREATYDAITSVLRENGVSFEDGQDVSEVMTKELRSQVTNILVEGFKSGEIELAKTHESEADLRAYASGLQSNWIRKDKRLNGNVSYVAKNPGSRIGAGDAQLKALNALLTNAQTAEEREEIQGYIDARRSEIQASKVKSKPVDFSALPEALRAKYQAS